jgi:hypothetical protein
MDFSSFLTSLGTSCLIFVILMLLFAWLSKKPGNAVVYYPNRILKGLDPFDGGSKTRNPFAWIHEAMSASEHDVISMSGLDTAVYFVFLGTGLSLLLFSRFLCVILVNFYDFCVLGFPFFGFFLVELNFCWIVCFCCCVYGLYLRKNGFFFIYLFFFTR